jgi:hypothetical protein
VVKKPVGNSFIYNTFGTQLEADSDQKGEGSEGKLRGNEMACASDEVSGKIQGDQSEMGHCSKWQLERSDHDDTRPSQKSGLRHQSPKPRLRVLSADAGPMTR